MKKIDKGKRTTFLHFKDTCDSDVWVKGMFRGDYHRVQIVAWHPEIRKPCPQLNKEQAQKVVQALQRFVDGKRR